MSEFVKFLSSLPTIAFFGLIVLSIICLINLFKSKPLKRHVVKMFSGTLGAGKTFLATFLLIRQYRRLYKRYKKRKKMRAKNNPRPVVYSNIPLYLGHKEYSEVLTREHLLLIDVFPDDVIPLVLIDEIGMIANQYSYDDPNIISNNVNDSFYCLEVFIRLFRHFYGDNNNDRCRLYVTDQASGGVNINLRRRFGCVDNLSNFRRFAFITPFYKIDVQELTVQEDNIVNVSNVQKVDGEQTEFYFGFLPYKFMTKLDRFKYRYDSHAYSAAKKACKFVPCVSFTNWRYNDYSFVNSRGELIIAPMKTNYCPDLRMSLEEKAQYKAKVKAIQAAAYKNISSE